MLVIPARRPVPMSVADPVPIPEKLPFVSLVVACWGQLHYTKGLVDSLEAHAGTPYELILVDNGCPEGTADWAEQRGLHVIRMGENAGVPRAYNAGVKAASGGIVGVWNNDMVCHPDGLRRLARASYARGIAAQSAGTWSAQGHYVASTSDPIWSDYAECYAMVAQREVWNSVGEWDPIFFPSYSDDVDWCLRARLKGYDWSIVEDAVTHYGGKTAQHYAGIDAKVAAHQGVIRERYLKLGLGQRILVQRWGAHGDLLMATPAIRGLKAQLPLARLHFQAQGDAGKVLVNNHHVDAVFESPCPSRAYTRVVNLNNVYEREQPRGKFRHPVEAFCEEAGVLFDGKAYDLTLSPALLEWSRAWLSQYGSLEGLVACGLRSHTRTKQNWSARGWLELAESLPEGQRLLAIDSHANPPLGHSREPGEDEEAFYRHPRVINMTGQTASILDAAALIAHCASFVGVDSGLMHVAHALGLPVVNLCAAAPLTARLPLTGSRVGFEGRAPCFPCQAPDRCPRTDGPHCLAHYTGVQVVTALSEVLA